jgi:outer membrane receptor protein involved in Fe transport
MKKRIFGSSVGFVALVLVVMAGSLMAQVGTGRIMGTVTDSTGAVLVGASVTITDAQTGVARQMVSNGAGLYVAPDLNVGVYNIEVKAKGFTGQRRVGVELQVGRQMEVDFSLAPGAQNETVTVQGIASQVETSTSEVSAQVGQSQMRELPLNGRDFEQLILLAPGVEQITSGEQDSFYGRAQAYSIAGSRPEGQELLLDGANIQTFWGHGAGNSIIGTSLGVDAIGEFQVLTNTYSARFGGSGSVMNQTTRSGTNNIHGSAFEFIRNSAVDAKNYFDSATQSIPEFRRNQFGGTVGGPVKKDKAFFFANYEGLRQLLGETQVVDIPDAQARLGIIGGHNYNPLNSGIAAALALYPAPSPAATERGGGVDQDLIVGNEPAHENYLNTRWDYTLGSKDSVFARYVYDNGNMTNHFGDDGTVGTLLGLYPQLSKGINQYLTIGEKRLASSTLLNDARVSFVRTNESAHTTAYNSALDFFPGENRQNGYLNIPGVSFLGPSAYTPDFEVQNTYSVGDDVVWTRGRHTISFGMEVERQQSNVMNSVFTNGEWSFTGLAGFLGNQPTSFLGALPGHDNSYRGFRETHLLPYFQDDWKVLPTLTLNLGLRYDFVANPTAVQALCAYEDPSDPTETACTPVSKVFASNPSVKALDPRVGFAWDVFKDHKTSLRGGVGLFHDPIGVRTYNASYLFTSPYTIGVQPCIFVGFCHYPTPFVPMSVAIPLIAEGVSYHADTTPFVMQYNLTVQREIASGTVLSLGYVGSRGYNLLVQDDLNPPIPNIINGVANYAKTTPGTEAIGTSTARANSTFFLGMPYSRPVGPSWYNSLQLYVTRNVGKTLQFQASYIYSKCLDEGSADVGMSSSNSAQTQYNPYNLAADKGDCNFDARQAVVGNAVYAIPFKQNTRIGGWQYGLIARAHSGNPFTVFDGFDRADLGDNGGIGNSPGGGERPNLVPGMSNNPKLGSAKGWYNPAAFALQYPGSIGDLGRNTLVAPGFMDFDMSLDKETRLTERMGMQIRFEVFNTFNHPDFALPDQTLYLGPEGLYGPGSCSGTTNCQGPGVPNPDAGVIHGTVFASRQMQLGAKFTF